MKKYLLFFHFIIIMIFLSNCAEKKALYKEGDFVGVGHGHHGPIEVIVSTDKYRIKDIEITKEYEMPEVSRFVYEKIPKEVIKENNIKVDVITGATYTSQGLINAIQNALKKAKAE